MYRIFSLGIGPFCLLLSGGFEKSALLSPCPTGYSSPLKNHLSSLPRYLMVYFCIGLCRTGQQTGESPRTVQSSRTQDNSASSLPSTPQIWAGRLGIVKRAIGKSNCPSHIAFPGNTPTQRACGDDGTAHRPCGQPSKKATLTTPSVVPLKWSHTPWYMQPSGERLIPTGNGKN